MTPDGLSPLGDFLRGAASYAEGVCGTFRYSARWSGLFGEEERIRAELEGLVVAEAIHQLARHRAARQIAFSVAFRRFVHSVRTEPFRILGRATAGYQVTQKLGAAGPTGTVLGLVLVPTALHGNLRLAIERGGHRVEDLIDALVRGEMPKDLGGRKSSFCGT